MGRGRSIRGLDGLDGLEGAPLPDRGLAAVHGERLGGPLVHARVRVEVSERHGQAQGARLRSLVHLAKEELDGVGVRSVGLAQRMCQLIDRSQLAQQEAARGGDEGKAARQVKVLGRELGQVLDVRGRLGRGEQLVLARTASHGTQCWPSNKKKKKRKKKVEEEEVEEEEEEEDINLDFQVSSLRLV